MYIIFLSRSITQRVEWQLIRSAIHSASNSSMLQVRLYIWSCRWHTRGCARRNGDSKSTWVAVRRCCRLAVGLVLAFRHSSRSTTSGQASRVAEGSWKVDNESRDRDYWSRFFARYWSSRISNVIGNVTRCPGYLIVLLYFDTFRIIFGGDGNE